MRWFAAVSLALFLTLSLVATAQLRDMPIAHPQLATAAGSVRAGVGVGIGPSTPGHVSIGPTGFPNGFHNPGFHNPNAPFHHHHFPRAFGATWPYAPYYGGYGYTPYAGGYGYPYAMDYDTDEPYTGYVPGTFNSTNPGYPYPAQYAPPANYYSPSSSPPPVTAPEQESNQYQTPSPRRSQAKPASDESAEPTVLVFRDGHRQEVSNYAIMGSTLLMLSGPRSRIPLAELDIAATEQANQSRGVDFRVPGKAN